MPVIVPVKGIWAPASAVKVTVPMSVALMVGCVAPGTTSPRICAVKTTAWLSEPVMVPDTAYLEPAQVSVYSRLPETGSRLLGWLCHQTSPSKVPTQCPARSAEVQVVLSVPASVPPPPGSGVPASVGTTTPPEVPPSACAGDEPPSARAECVPASGSSSSDPVGAPLLTQPARVRRAMRTSARI